MGLQAMSRTVGYAWSSWMWEIIDLVSRCQALTPLPLVPTSITLSARWSQATTETGAPQFKTAALLALPCNSTLTHVQDLLQISITRKTGSDVHKHNRLNAIMCDTGCNAVITKARSMGDLQHRSGTKAAPADLRGPRCGPRHRWKPWPGSAHWVRSYSR